MEIGIRELRDHLSRHLLAVRDGSTITVTDHGRPVARLVPIEQPTSLERLISEGRVTVGAERKGTRRPPVATAEGVSDLVDDQRR